MRLLFDHNLSHRLCDRLSDLFPDSTQTRLLGFETAPDQAIWEHAGAYGLAVVTLDKDFADMAVFRGAPHSASRIFQQKYQKRCVYITLEATVRSRVVSCVPESSQLFMKTT